MVIHISNDTQQYTPYYPVADSVIEQLILTNVDNQNILGKGYLSKPISGYGGIYFSGFVGARVDTLSILNTLPTSSSPKPG